MDHDSTEQEGAIEKGLVANGEGNTRTLRENCLNTSGFLTFYQSIIQAEHSFIPPEKHPPSHFKASTLLCKNLRLQVRPNLKHD